MQKINILYVSTTKNANSYGAEKRLFDIVRHLDKSKFQPIILLPEAGSFSARLEGCGLKTLIYDFVFPWGKSNPLKILKLTKWFLDIVRREKINLAHFNMHYFIANFWLGIVLSRLPIVVHSRACYWIGIVDKFFMSRCSRIIFISRATRDVFLRKRRSDVLMGNISRKNKVVYDGIDIGRFNGDLNPAIRKELKADTNTKIVALVGALDPVKGQDIYIKAAKIVSERFPNIKFLIVGDTYFLKASRRDYVNDLKRLVQDLNFSEKIIFTGYRDDIPELMGGIDILVQPSSTEGLGTSLVEAMAAGKPVVGTMIGGILEVIGDNEEAGILLKERNPEDLAKAILYLLDHPDEMRKKGLAGRERVLKYFDVHKNIKQIEDVYCKVLGTQKDGIYEG